jgi:serine/threonine-protein kinase HipA
MKETSPSPSLSLLIGEEALLSSGSSYLKTMEELVRYYQVFVEHCQRIAVTGEDLLLAVGLPYSNWLEQKKPDGAVPTLARSLTARYQGSGCLSPGPRLDQGLSGHPACSSNGERARHRHRVQYHHLHPVLTAAETIRNHRRFFASAMTMLGHIDTEDASYLEMAEFLATYGEADNIARNLEELFTRVAFNVATANRDDHLRNHGFIRSPDGWRLAPAFDMNPSFRKDEHVLSLDLYNRQPDPEVVLATADYYRLEIGRARKIVTNVCKVVGGWKAHARKLGLTAQECVEAEHLFLSDPHN